MLGFILESPILGYYQVSEEDHEDFRLGGSFHD